MFSACFERIDAKLMVKNNIFFRHVNNGPDSNKKVEEDEIKAASSSLFA